MYQHLNTESMLLLSESEFSVHVISVCGDDCDFNTDGEIMFQPDCVYCNVYRTCFGTLANRHVCSEGLAFSLATKSCDRVENVDCG